MDFEAYNLYGAAERAGAAAASLQAALGADFRPDQEVAQDEKVTGCLMPLLEQISVAKGCLHRYLDLRQPLSVVSLPLTEGRGHEYHKKFAHSVAHWASATCIMYGGLEESSPLHRCLFYGDDPELGADFPQEVKRPESIALFLGLLGFSGLLLRYRRQAGFAGVAPYREDWYVG